MTEALKNLIRRVPGRVWLAVGGLLAAALWMQQHDARIRQQAGLQQLRNETSAQVSALRRRAAQNVQQANIKNAQAVAKLEQRRQQVEQQNRELAAQLDRLRKQAQIRAGEAATLPISEIVTRVAAQLGLKADDVASGKAADMAKGAIPQGGTPPEQSGKVTPHPVPASGTTLSPRRELGSADSAPNPVALALTSSGARKVEASLVALDACRAESGIQARQFSNCHVRAAADEAAIEHLNGSVASLNQALQTKDKILVEQQSEYKAELRAARGTFLGRLARVTEHVAIGVAVGVLIGAAVK